VSLTVGTRPFFMELAETTAAGTESRRADRDRSRQGIGTRGQGEGRVLSGNVIAVGAMFAAMGSALIAFLALHK
jgi:hypothetical protein